MPLEFSIMKIRRRNNLIVPIMKSKFEQKLMFALTFTHDDLAANRARTLSDVQKQRLEQKMKRWMPETWKLAVISFFVSLFGGLLLWSVNESFSLTLILATLWMVAVGNIQTVNDREYHALYQDIIKGDVHAVRGLIRLDIQRMEGTLRIKQLKFKIDQATFLL